MLITIDNLSKSFGQKEILKNVKMTVNEKCRYGLIGVNGAGKSTLLKIIMQGWRRVSRIFSCILDIQARDMSRSPTDIRPW